MSTREGTVATYSLPTHMVKSTEDRRRPFSSVARKNMRLKAKNGNKPNPNLPRPCKNKLILQSVYLFCFTCICVVSYFTLFANIFGLTKTKNVTHRTRVHFEADVHNA